MGNRIKDAHTGEEKFVKKRQTFFCCIRMPPFALCLFLTTLLCYVTASPSPSPTVSITTTCEQCKDSATGYFGTPGSDKWCDCCFIDCDGKLDPECRNMGFCGPGSYHAAP